MLFSNTANDAFVAEICMYCVYLKSNNFFNLHIIWANMGTYITILQSPDLFLFETPNITHLIRMNERVYNVPFNALPGYIGTATTKVSGLRFRDQRRLALKHLKTITLN